MNRLLGRLADSLGWTHGQAWTVLVGLVVAVPAALFGLGPSLNVIRHSKGVTTVAAPAPSVVSPPAKAPAILDATIHPPLVVAAPAVGLPAFTPVAAVAGPAVDGSSEAEVAAPPMPIEPAVRLTGPGKLTGVAVAADALVAVVDLGSDQPARVVVFDRTGSLVFQKDLVVDGVAYREPGGVAVTAGSVLVGTSAPAAVLRLDPATGAVTKLADVPDLPLCIPGLRSTGCQPSVPDAGPALQHLAVAESGDVYVADRAQACIFRIPAGAHDAAAWLCDIAFSSSLTAPGGGLAGLAAAGDQLVLTVAGAVDGSDTVDAVKLGPQPTDRHQLAAAPKGAGVAGVAVLADGRVVVALRAVDALLVIAGSGSHTASVATKLDGPFDVGVRDGTLWVAQRAEGLAGEVVPLGVELLG